MVRLDPLWSCASRCSVQSLNDLHVFTCRGIGSAVSEVSPARPPTTQQKNKIQLNLRGVVAVESQRIHLHPKWQTIKPASTHTKPFWSFTVGPWSPVSLCFVFPSRGLETGITVACKVSRGARLVFSCCLATLFTGSSKDGSQRFSAHNGLSAAASASILECWELRCHIRRLPRVFPVP